MGLLAPTVALSVAFFSVLDTALLKGLPFPDGDRLVAFSTRDAAGWPMPVADYEAIAEAQQSFEWTLPLRTYNTMITRGDHTVGVIGSYVPAALFDRLGVQPILGRGFTADDEAPSSPAVVLISHRLWKHGYGSDPDILGQSITLNREPGLVVGVMPPGFGFPLRHDVWGVFGRQGREWQEFAVFGIGKLATGAEIGTVRRDLGRIAANLDTALPADEPRKTSVDTLARSYIGEKTQGALHAMVFAALGLMLLSWANLANLRLSEALRRTAEIDTRLVLGSGPFALAGRLLLENLILGLAGTVAGLGLAVVLVKSLAPLLLAGGRLERIFWVTVEVDWRAATFAGACGLFASLAGAWVPALSVLRAYRAGSLGRVGSNRRATGAWARSSVSLQVGLSFALLVIAGLWTLKAHELLDSAPGFPTRGLSSTTISTYQADLGESQDRLALLDRLRLELGTTDGVKAVAIASAAPWGRVPRVEVSPEARDSADEQESAGRITAETLQVSPGFFDTLQLDLLVGRIFNPKKPIPPWSAVPWQSACSTDMPSAASWSSRDGATIRKPGCGSWASWRISAWIATTSPIVT